MKVDSLHSSTKKYLQTGSTTNSVPNTHLTFSLYISRAEKMVKQQISAFN